jgi:uncharacterized protein (DUF302 family)
MNALKKFVSITLCALITAIVIVRAMAPAAAEMANAAPTGMEQFISEYSVAETGDRLEALLNERQLNVFNRIDHAQNAASVGRDLRETLLFIFGNPNVGTPLMQCNQSVAIDLPQKMLIWQNESEQVMLAYNDPQYLMERHHLAGCEMVIDRISQVLADLATRATQG